MACLSCVGCYGTTVEDVSRWFLRARLSVNNGFQPLLGNREKQSFDPYRLGVIIDGAKYRQTYAIRSSDVGSNKTATMESILNLFQETKENQLRLTGLVKGDGFGTTCEMVRNSLLWVLTKMQVEVDHYPIWGDILDIDTWFVPSNGLELRRDWIVRCHKTGFVFLKGTSKWVMMNHETRRLVRMPKAVKDELLPWFVNKQIISPVNEKIQKLSIDNVTYKTLNIKPKRSDLDMNNHVNNVKLLRWMLETFPDQFVETHQLSSITLEYKRECKSSDSVESFVGLHTDEILSSKVGQAKYIHVLQTDGANKSEEIVRGNTTWKRNICVSGDG